ncbi:Putative uroporphyrinogen-III C-methyltransferase [Vibrio aerogenes CECT 7868]|uniref:Putative uroporphyrinogen-III C-methyltransferase n=1 Tax=Vibrio aerogenes CECT 7868 TaxID=1216006 RepID=A0A1M5ZF23_9VIBR|nr:uroporphyrinogen-III C-methyltransferase [Vibrio aerogenes]SHI22817.1 Putative uroporphyrinogen-III C-methyltransferase [Vibrio aerogenes CECT 7868]
MTDKKNQPEKQQPKDSKPESQVSPAQGQTSSGTTQHTSGSSAKTSTPKQKDKATPGTGLAKTAIILSLILAGGMGAYVYHIQKNYQTQIASLQQQLQNSVSELNQQVTSQDQSTQEKLVQTSNKFDTLLNQQQKSLESLQLALADMKGRRPNDWLLAESDYLVKLAGRKLFLEHDVQSATLLMESADQRIAALNDPSLVPLRKSMAHDITTLKAVPLIDKDGLVLRLTSLQQQIKQLPLANAILPDAPEIQKEEVTENISDWQHNLLTSAKDFVNNFITFRTRDGNVIPLLSPKQDFYLRENLKAKLETAIRAVYDEQQAVYSTALSTAREWSVSFLNQENNHVQQFNHMLETLSKKNIQVNYPVKLESQSQLTDIINTRLRKEVTSLTEDDS